MMGTKRTSLIAQQTAIILILACLLLGVTPALATPSAEDKPEEANAYGLVGDATNIGGGVTTFDTNSGSTSGGWRFFDRTNNGRGMNVTCQGDDCIGAFFSGGKRGLYAASFNFTTNAQSYGLYGESFGNGTNAVGVVGYANSTNSGDPTIGVRGTAASNAGTGVLGTAPKYGVRGYAIGALSFGGFFSSTTGTGLRGSSTSGYGVYALSNSNYAIYATSSSKHAILAASGSQDGVHGTSGNGYGVWGGGGAGGVYGESSDGPGVYGYSANSFGIYGFSQDLYGITGGSDTSIGIRATSDTGVGLWADSTTNYGGRLLTTSGTAALRATHQNPGAGKYAIIADGDVLVNGDISCTAGCTQATSFKTASGDHLMYAESGTRNLFSDSGTATLKDGRAIIQVDPLFAESVSLDAGYQVFVTPRTFDTPGLGVANHSATSFEVRELNGGKGNFSFDYRITALRKGFEAERMERAPVLPDQPADAPVTRPGGTKK